MKKNIALFLLIFSTFIGHAHAEGFSDVPATHQNYRAVKYLTENGVLKGYEDGTFKPEKTVNRAEAIKIILEGTGIKSIPSPEESPFTDVPVDQWFAPYVAEAKRLSIVSGNPDGSFAPSSNVQKAAFIKMLLETNKFKKEKWGGQQFYNDVGQNEWYNPYMNYAGKSGLILPDEKNNLSPDKNLTRSEVAEIMYLMRVILNGKDTQFLLTEAEFQMAQIETYIGAKNIMLAKRSAELSYDFTQQALKNMPENNVVLGAAKLGKAYQLVVDAFIAGIKKDHRTAMKYAEEAKVKATEAWEANNDLQPIAKHLKTRADEILAQLQ
ncbi:MAG: S-layer homology domain-containing protein [Candidatus Altimarinota bacterium]